jgi:ATP-citrate lyase alpha-subunit
MDELRKQSPSIIFLGIHAGIIQSVLDYDYMLNKEKPSILAIVAKGRSSERFFWGDKEVSIRIYADLKLIDETILSKVNMVVNAQSARHVKTATLEAIHDLPNLKVITILQKIHQSFMRFKYAKLHKTKA